MIDDNVITMHARRKRRRCHLGGRRGSELLHVVGHGHMAEALFAWLPGERVMMEGDLGDEAWDFHWWAGAMQANIDHYGISPLIDVAVHGTGPLPILMYFHGGGFVIGGNISSAWVLGANYFIKGDDLKLTLNYMLGDPAGPLNHEGRFLTRLQVIF